MATPSITVRLDRPVTDVWKIQVDDDLYERVRKLADRWHIGIGEAGRMLLEWGIIHNGHDE